MSEPAQSLSARRLELRKRVAVERQALRDHTQGIQAALGSLARGFSPARWLGASPLLLAGGALVTLVLGRGRVLRTIGAAVAIVELLRRYRNTFRLVGKLVDDQSVRRSR